MRSPATRPLLFLPAVCACTCIIAEPLLAQSATGVGGSVGVTNDYVYRGISQTTGNPALQADLHYRSGNGWTLGAWGSHADVEPGEGTESEIDLYISKDWNFDPNWNLRATWSHYLYPNDSRQLRYSYDELITTLSYRSRLFATLAWSPNISRYANGVGVEDGTAISYELAAAQPLFGQLSALAGVGYYNLPATLDADYWFWNAGLACSFGHAQFTVSYIDTDENASRAFGYRTTGGRWAGMVGWRF